MRSINPELVRKFFDGKCSPEEVHQVLIWINSEEGKKQLEEDFEKFQTAGKDNPIDEKSVLDKIHKKIEQIESKSNAKEEGGIRKLGDRSNHKWTLTQYWKSGIAISFLLTVVASALWFFSIRREENLLDSTGISQIEYLTKQTKAGEKLTLKLNDGSIIQLHSNSKIRFPKYFTGEKREVFMEGQVFFDVHRDEKHPFIVYSRGLITSVLGTSFAIEEDSTSRSSQVAVLTGQVKVGKVEQGDDEDVKELYLKPMEAASFNGTQGSFEKIKVDYDNAFAWKDNVIVFQNESFSEVIKILESWFGVGFQINKTIKNNQDYSGRFEDQTLEEILIGLSFTYDFESLLSD